MSEVDVTPDSNLPAVVVTPPVEIDPRPYDRLSIKDIENPFSVINIVPEWLAELIKGIPDSTFKMAHKSLVTQARPSKAEERLRLSFWSEYDRVIHRDQPEINLANVFGGVYEEQAFKDLVSESKFKLAYMLSPPPSLNLVLDEVIHTGYDQMKKIMDEPLVDENGKFNIKLAELKNKILSTALMKRHGRTTNINIKSQNLHAVKKFEEPAIDAPPAEELIKTAADIEAVLRDTEIDRVIDEQPEEL